MNKGKYIVLEGPEGVGKTTQIQELARRLQLAGLPVRTLREPDSQSDLTARALRQLTQDPRYPMNTNTEVLLYNAARSQSLQIIKRSVEQGVICLVDRNYLTTLAIQYYGRGDVPDYETINKIISFAVNDVEPDLCVVLDAPVPVLRQRAHDRGQGERFDNLDEAFLERVRAGYLWEAKQRELPVVFATEDSEIVANEIWKLVTNTLAVRDNKLPSAEQSPVSIKQIIENRQAANSPEPPVILSPQHQAEAIVAPRTITKHTGNSMQWPAALSLVAENISNIVLNKLEQGSCAIYEEASPYYFDQKDKSNQYYYVIPDAFNTDVRRQYIEAMDTIFELYSAMVRGLTDHLISSSKTTKNERNGTWKSAVNSTAHDTARAVLPIAAKTMLAISGDKQTIENLITHLLSDELSEARSTGQILLQQARQIIPNLLDQLDGTTDDTALTYSRNTTQAMKELTQELLSGSHAASDNTSIALVDYWPKNELQLVAGMLYEDSNLPLEQIQTIVNSWSYDQKAEVLKTYIGERLNRRHRPGRALEKAHYSWDLVSEYAVFKDLQRHRMVDDLNWQALTPRYGYDIPKLIEEASLTEQFEACFDVSLKLYSLLQQSGYQLEAQYATLQGHKMRWKVTYNAREAFHLHELRTSPQGHPAYRKFVQEMHEKVAEVHPLLAEAMKFVNKGEDEELTRLAAERYTQYKLQQLDDTNNKT